MKEVLRERTLIRLTHFQAVLEAAGIPTFIRNENIGNIEVPIPTFCPALCVVEDSDYEKAVGLIRDSIREAETASTEESPCPHCGEPNPRNFDVCWSCGGDLG